MFFILTTTLRNWHLRMYNTYAMLTVTWQVSSCFAPFLTSLIFLFVSHLYVWDRSLGRVSREQELQKSLLDIGFLCVLRLSALLFPALFVSPRLSFSRARGWEISQQRSRISTPLRMMRLMRALSGAQPARCLVDSIAGLRTRRSRLC